MDIATSFKLKINQQNFVRRYKQAELIIYCYITTYPQTQQYKTTNTYDLTVSVGQESGCRLAGCLWLRVPRKAVVKLLAGAAVVSRLDWRRIHFQAHLGGCWQDSVIPGRWLEMAVRPLPRAPPPTPRPSHNMAAGFPQSK